MEPIPDTSGYSTQVSASSPKLRRKGGHGNLREEKPEELLS